MITKIINPKLSRSEKMAFERYVKANMKRAYFSALGIIGSHDAAMELSQAAFIKAYRNFKSFDRTRNFFTWYYTILRNLCLNYIRDTKSKNKIAFDNQIEWKNDTNPADDIERKELKRKLWESIRQLEFEDREIIILKEFEGLAYKEISETLKIPIGTVMSRLYCARKKLAKKLEVFK